MIARKDRRDRNGFVFLWGEGLKFCSSKKLRSNNDHISRVRGSFFGACKFWKIEIFGKITIVSLHERKTAAYFRGI